MSWLLALLIGGLIGWLSSYAYKRSERNIVSDTIAGAIGAILGLWVFGNLFGLGSGVSANLNSFSVRGLTWTLLGSLTISWIVEGIYVAGARSARKEIRGTAYSHEVRERKRYDRDEEDEM